MDQVLQVKTPYHPTLKAIPDEKLDVLHSYLCLAHNAFGDIMTGKKGERLYYILPILACVCSLIEDARLVDKYEVVGKSVPGGVTFDFVLERGRTRVCVIEAKRDDFQQGLAQFYVGVKPSWKRD
ncbi:hypothetical protein V7S43_010428 [Phytophthora oleae]|uniref:PD-(D/E)XK nuclease superfamily protein n=1 Tax=Phytophthora oleae TaxID=2107226 RepID=A0ABD3FED9_9STRA